MKNKIKENYIFIISFIILLILLCTSIFLILKDQRLLDEKVMNIKKNCLTENFVDEETIKMCNRILTENNKNYDFYSIFSEIIVMKFSGWLSFSISLFVVIPSLLHVCKNFKNRIILNESTRCNYHDYLKRLFKTAYKSIWIIPIIIFVAIIFSLIYTGSFDASYSISKSATFWNESTLNNPLLFILLYILNIIVHSILYVNIGLCVARKNHNYFVAIILSFLLFIAIEAFLEIAINGILLFSILNTEIGMIFNIMNMFTFNETYGIITPIIVPFVITVLSFIMIYFMYRDKEKLIIDCEKNE